MRRAIRIQVCLALAMLLPPQAGLARKDAADLCLQAAANAARQSEVPLDVLLAVAVVETGRAGRPWPWTVNLGGEGHWFASAAEAEKLVEAALEKGLTNIDLGCFQLNYRWHARSFGSVADMLDPDRNATYAAGYLARHHAETGDWATAAAAYHSATPEHAERYRARFEAAWASMAGEIGPSAPADPPTRSNSFPLLIAGKTGSHGSLVPATSGGLRLIGGP